MHKQIIKEFLEYVDYGDIPAYKLLKNLDLLKLNEDSNLIKRKFIESIINIKYK